MSLRTREKRKLGFAVPISIKSTLSLPVVLIGRQGYVYLSTSSVHVSVLFVKFIWLILGTEVAWVSFWRGSILCLLREFKGVKTADAHLLEVKCADSGHSTPGAVLYSVT